MAIKMDGPSGITMDSPEDGGSISTTVGTNVEPAQRLAKQQAVPPLLGTKTPPKWDRPTAPVPSPIEEDWRRVKSGAKKFGNIVMDGVDLAKDAYNFIGSPEDNLNIVPTKPEAEAYGKGSLAHSLDEGVNEVFNRPTGEALRNLGHGLMPQTINAPKTQTPLGPDWSPITTASIVKDRAMKPVVDAGHALQKGPGKSIAESALDIRRPIDQAMVGEESALAAEYLSRIGFSFIAGQDVKFAEGGTGTNKAIGVLENKLGVTGTAAASAIAEEVGKLPLYLLGTGRGAAAVQAEKEAILAGGLGNAAGTAAKLGTLASKEGAIEGLAQGAIQTMVTPGQDIVSGPLVGAVMGHMLGGLTSKGYGEKAMMSHHSALLPAETWDGFIKEITQLTERRMTKGLQFVGDGDFHPNVRMTPPDGEFKPLFASVTKTPEGKLVGQEIEIRLGAKAPYHAEVSIVEVPIDTHAKAVKWRNKLQEVGLSPERRSVPTDEVGAASYSEWLEKAYNPRYDEAEDFLWPAKKDRSYKSMESDNAYSSPEEMLQHPNVRAKANQMLMDTPEDMLRRQFKVPEEFPNSAFPRILVSDAENRQRLVAMIVNPGAYKPSETWKLSKGDLVTTPTGESRVISGFHKDGRVYAKKLTAGGKGSLWKNEDLRFVVDKDGVTPNKMGPSFLDDDTIRKAVTPLERVTIPRVANTMGVDPTVAADIVLKLEKKGELVYRGNGVWDVKSRLSQDVQDFEPWGRRPEGPLTAQGHRPKGEIEYPPLYVPGQKNAIQEGLEVFVGTGHDGQGVKAVLRGPDKHRINNYILEVPKEGLIQQLEAKGALAKIPGTNIEVARSGKETYFRSIHKDELKSVIPTNLAKKTLQQIIDIPGQYGFNLPHPPGFIVTTSNFQQEVNKVQSLLNASRTPSVMGSTALGKLKTSIEGQILNAYYLTPPMLRRKATPLYGAMSSSREAMLRGSERLKQGVGAYGSQADRDLIPVIEASVANGMQDKALTEWAMKYPKEAADVMGTLKHLLDERKLLSDWLGKRGVKSIDMLEQMRGAGEEPEYVTMMYAVHVLKDKYPDWAKKNIPQVWESAVNYLTRGTRGAQDIEARLASVLRQNDPAVALAKSGMVDAATAAKLIERKDLPGPIKDLLGKVPSASLRLGHTVGYQRALKNTIETWDNIAASEWWVPDIGSRKQFSKPGDWSSPRADLQVPVPNRPEYGAAAGGWTHKSLANFVTKPATSEAGSFMKMVGFMGGKWKSFHTVYGGPAPWVNNVVRNLKGVVLSGGYEGPEDVEGFRRAPGLLLSYRDNPSVLGPASVVIEAKQFSALSAGFAGAEIHDARTRIQDELLRAMNRASGNANTMEDMVMAAQDWMRNSTENVKDAYDAIDQYFKLATYINLRKKFVGEGMSIHDAAALSAERINASYPNYELVGPLVEKMRPYAGFGAGYFLSSKAEDMRINAMLMARVGRSLNPMSVNELKLKEPGLVLRLAAAGSMLYGASAMMQSLRRSNGITDQDIEDADSAVAMKAKGWSPASVYGWDYDEKGRLVRYDMTPFEDVFMMLRGNVNDPIAARMFHNTVLDLVGDGTWAGRGWTAGANATGLITEKAKEPRPIGFAEGGPLQLMQTYAEMGGIPQAFLRLPSALAKGDDHPESPFNEPWTGSQVAQKAIGLPMAGPVGQGSMMSTLMEGKGQIRGLKGEIRKVPRRIGVDEPRANYLIDAKVQGLQGVADRMGKTRQPPGKIKMSTKK